jgi:hypothetical protein
MQVNFQPLCLIARQPRWPHFLSLTIDERQGRIFSSKFGLRHCEVQILATMLLIVVVAFFLLSLLKSDLEIFKGG